MALNIRPIKETVSDSGVKILVYAQSGTGKTSLAGTFSGRTLILNAENGTAVIKDSNCDVIDTPNEASIIEVYQAILNGEIKYDNYVLDSITEIAESMALALKADPYYGDPKNSFKFWDELKRKIVVMMKAFRDLKNCNVMFCALEADVEINALQILHPMVPGKSSMKILPSIFDEVLRLTSDADGTRKLHTSGRMDYVAKTRYGIEDGTTDVNIANLYQEHLYSSQTK